MELHNNHNEKGGRTRKTKEKKKDGPWLGVVDVGHYGEIRTKVMTMMKAMLEIQKVDVRSLLHQGFIGRQMKVPTSRAL